ncbi:MAG: hypothetical protein SGILL_003284, partial [Bacillariaceae sp.]
LAVVWFYSLSRWKNLVTAVWLYYSAGDDGKDNDNDNGHTCESDKNKEIRLDEERADDEDWLPPVTVQILSYNEAEVVPTTIDKACALNYPADRLFIHVLDDSTDPHATELVQRAVERHAKQGVQISYKTRANRHGYKAGNLATHFDDIETDFVLYLDGDHQVQPDMLQQTIPYFNNKPKLALVQTPWGYYNSHANLLTECDSIGLDVHHTIEQTARSHLYKVFGFNGTGGVWRKQAIADAGGWTWDTVTEDLAISYLAHLEGYTFRYLSDCPQMLELPRNLLAHIQQKQRWTKGFMQVFRLYYWRILFSKHGNFWIKMEAFMHFTGPIQIVAAVTGILIFPYLVFHDIHTPLIEAVSIFPTIEPICSAIHAILTKATAGNANYSTTRIFVLLPYFALRFGMAPFELKAVCEGLFSNDATFHSTPKEGAVSNERRKDANAAAAIKGHWSDDFVAYVGLFVGLHQLIYIMIYDVHFERSTWFEFGIRILNLLVCVGMTVVSAWFLFLKHRIKWAKSDHKLQRLFSSRTIYPLTVAVCFFYVSSMCIFHAGTSMRYSAAPKMTIKAFEQTEAIIAIGSNATSNSTTISHAYKWKEENSFLCLPPDQPKSNMVQLRPLVVFAEPRSGSNLLFDMLDKRNIVAKESNDHHFDIETLPLFEMFANYKHEYWRQVKAVRKKVSQTCLLADEKYPTYLTRNNRNNVTLTENAPVFDLIDSVLGARQKHPEDVLDLLHQLPSFADRGYYAFKVFASHFETIGSPSKLIRMMLRNHDPGTKFVVLWRRRMIESFVSFSMAVATGSWTNGQKSKLTTEAPKTVYLEEPKLRAFIEKQRRYYKSVKQALEAAGVDYTVLEYSQDMLTTDSQVTTIEHLEHLLGAASPSLANATLSQLQLKKQQKRGLAEVVSNWKDVVRWGFGGEVEDWEDLFA